MFPKLFVQTPEVRKRIKATEPKLQRKKLNGNVSFVFFGTPFILGHKIRDYKA